MPVTLPAAETNPDVKILPPEMFPVVLTTPPGGGIKLPTKFDATILPVELISPEVSKLSPVMLPVALITPVTYCPVVDQTTILLVPPTPTVMLPPEVAMSIFDEPLLMLATLVITPVSKAPLPNI